jgi:hypothetical protein
MAALAKGWPRGVKRHEQADRRLDSERFRFVPRTCRPLWGRIADGNLIDGIIAFGGGFPWL